MKKISAMLLACVLTVGLSFTVWADDSANSKDKGSFRGMLSSLFSEDGPLDDVFEDGSPVMKLFEEDGPLSSYIPEDVDVKGILQDVQQELADRGSALYEQAGELIQGMTDENGDFDMSKLGELSEIVNYLAEEGLGIGSGEEKPDDDLSLDFDPAMGDYDIIVQTVYDYIDENYGVYLAPGDEKLFYYAFMNLSTQEDGTVKVLGYFGEEIFTLEDNAYALVSGLSNYELMTVQKEEDGTYTVLEEKIPEDGEGYSDSLNDMFVEFGITPEEGTEKIIGREALYLDELKTFLENHPEAEKIEYMGEMKTLEEITELSDAAFDEFFTAFMGQFEIPEEAMSE